MKTALFTYVLKNIQVFSGIHFVHLYPPFSTIYDMGMSPGRGIFFRLFLLHFETYPYIHTVHMQSYAFLSTMHHAACEPL